MAVQQLTETVRLGSFYCSAPAYNLQPGSDVMTAAAYSHMNGGSAGPSHCSSNRDLRYPGNATAAAAAAAGSRCPAVSSHRQDNMMSASYHPSSSSSAIHQLHQPFHHMQPNPRHPQQQQQHGFYDNYCVDDSYRRPYYVGNGAINPERTRRKLSADDGSVHSGLRRVPTSASDEGSRAAEAPVRRAGTNWSPVPTLSRAVSEHTLHRYQGSDGLHVDLDQSCPYSELESILSPPRIAPVSGKLNQCSGQTVIKPVPFKPVAVAPTTSTSNPSRYNCAPHSRTTSGPCPAGSSGRPAGTRDTRLSTDEGYSSSSRSNTGDLANHSSSSEASQSSLLHTSGTADAHRELDDEFEVDCRGRRTSVSRDDGRTAGSSRRGAASSPPPPAPSAAVVAAATVASLEAALRGKDAELRRLRETMEQNETAIVEVLQERRRGWQAQMTALSQEWERKLRCQQQQSFRTEQSLLLQVFKLQQDNRVLKSRVDQGRGTGAGAVAEELRAMRARIDELQWQLHERTGEAASLRGKLSGAQSELHSCSAELESTLNATGSLRATVEGLESELAVARDGSRHDVERAADAERRLATVEDCLARAEQERDAAEHCSEQLRAELSRARAAQDEERVAFEREREQWLDEKRRVIDYQKQLQLNYVQMARKNRILEADVQQLTSEIERNDVSPPRGVQTVGITEESMC